MRSNIVWMRTIWFTFTWLQAWPYAFKQWTKATLLKVYQEIRSEIKSRLVLLISDKNSSQFIESIVLYRTSVLLLGCMFKSMISVKAGSREKEAFERPLCWNACTELSLKSIWLVDPKNLFNTQIPLSTEYGFCLSREKGFPGKYNHSLMTSKSVSSLCTTTRTQLTDC